MNARFRTTDTPSKAHPGFWNVTSLLRTAVARVWIASWAIAALAHIRFWLPESPVPVTGQTLGVFLVGAALGPRLGAVATLLYLGQGLLGLPFFASGLGSAVVWGVSGGYLLSFPLAAAFVGWMIGKLNPALRRPSARGLTVRTAVFLVGHSFVLACGAAWMARTMGWEASWAMGVAPFLVGSVLKSLAASALTFRLPRL